jgi:Protein of unknown function (DUF3667)
MPTEFAAAADIATGAILARAVEPTAGDVSDSVKAACLNCQTPMEGAFCSSCGQKARVHRTLAAFGHDILHGVLHFDGKIWRTIPMLILNPGHLTRRYIHGERARFVSPMALFLFTVFLTFAVFSRLAPAEIGTSPQISSQKAALELADEKRAVLSDIAGLEEDRAKEIASGDGTQMIETELARQRKLLKTIETTKTDDLRRSVVVDRRIAFEKQRQQLVVTRLEASLAEAKHGGQPTKAIEEELAGEKQAAELLNDTTDAIRNRSFKGITSKADIDFFGSKALNVSLKHAIENPQLLLYKVQSNAYKFSWALIPISIPFIWLLFFWRREFKMFDHAVFVTYSLCFMLTLFSVAALIAQWEAIAVIGGLMMIFIPPLHMHRQIRQAYGTTFLGGLGRTSAALVFAVIAMALFISLIVALGVTG